MEDLPVIFIEVAALLKTRKKLCHSVIEEVQKQHSCEVPCIVFRPFLAVPNIFKPQAYQFHLQ